MAHMGQPPSRVILRCGIAWHCQNPPQFFVCLRQGTMLFVGCVCSHFLKRKALRPKEDLASQDSSFLQFVRLCLIYRCEDESVVRIT